MKNYIIVILLILVSILLNAQEQGVLLFEAIVNNDNIKAEQLIKEGTDIHFIKTEGPFVKTNLLIQAVIQKNLMIAGLLIEHNIDVHWRDGFNTTAILYAVHSGDIEMVKLLLNHGADIYDNDGQGNNAITASEESNNEEMIEFVKLRMQEKQK